MKVRHVRRVTVGCWAVLAIGLAASQASGQALPVATPESVGMAGDRLDRMKAVIQDYVDRQQVAGVVTILVRAGKVVSFEPIGRMDVEKNVPIRKDTIFRMASMSKAVTSVAADDPRWRKRRSACPTRCRSSCPPSSRPRSPSRRGRRSRCGIVPGEARDHHSRPAHAHGRDLLRRRPGRRRSAKAAGHPGLVPVGPEGADRPADGAPRRAALRRAAGRAVRLRLQHRHPRRGGGEGLGHAARRVLPHPDLRAAEDDRHVLLPAAGEAGAGLRRSTRWAADGRIGPRAGARHRARATTWTGRAPVSAAAPACCPRRTTTRASSRCC